VSPAGDWRWTLPEDFAGFPAPSSRGRTRRLGHLAIIAAVRDITSAVLAARGAQRAQPGLITLFTHEPVYHAIAPQLQAVMVNVWQPALKLPGAVSALLMGRGLQHRPADEIKMMTPAMARFASR